MKERGQLLPRPHPYDATGCIVKNILLKESLCLVQMLYIFIHFSSSKTLVHFHVVTVRDTFYLNFTQTFKRENEELPKNTSDLDEQVSNDNGQNHKQFLNATPAHLKPLHTTVVETVIKRTTVSCKP